MPVGVGPADVRKEPMRKLQLHFDNECGRENTRLVGSGVKSKEMKEELDSHSSVLAMK